ncbi:MAG: beta-N-acetylhexosaminidase [Eubacterium sp.]|nr:beta-N-acetylhexosaminidase [Eubacterium sp.]MDE6766754.1 beta-N-acetylhexosaminidase [Eubacterium sp.]
MKLIPQPKSIHIINRNASIKSDNITTKITDDLTSSESYRLTINKNGILIEGADNNGIYYGLVTLNQIKENYGDNLPELEISDNPVYSYRGFMIDSCRHFFTADEIKKMIDAAAMLKFNYFHFHLSDDQGFRMEIDSWNKLTTQGSKRKGSYFGKSEKDDRIYQHYYTKAELRDIVEYCKQRHIEVIPELDIPGHTTAILSAYPELSCRKKAIDAKMKAGVFDDILCAGNPDTMKMIKDVINEMCEIFTGPYFHIGGDEAPKVRWNKCPKCQAKLKELGLTDMEQLHCHMVNEISEFLKSKGKKAICWNEALNGGNLKNDNMTIAYWLDKTDNGIKWANGGNPIIIEKFNPYYADYPYGMYPLSSVYKFNPRKIKGLTVKGQKAIIGIETPIWTEYITTFDKMSYMCFPRWFAIADTAWNGNENKDYKKFLDDAEFYCNTLKKQGHNPAPKSDWSPLPLNRLSSTLKFAGNLMTKEMLNQLLFKKKDED